MNPHDRENAPQRLQRTPDHPPWTVFNISTPRVNRDWETCSQYSVFPHNDLQDSLEDNLGSKGLGSPLNDSDSEDRPDGEPLDVQNSEDPELKRKLKELEEIEQRIQRKKFDIALKKVEPFVKETLAQGFHCNKPLSTSNGATLKDRVNVILQQRHSASFLSKVQSHADRMKADRLRAQGLQQDHHPLKLRVKALMKQRSRDPAAFARNLEVSDVTLSPPSQRTSSPAKGESNNQGFQRFVSLLNKGVDIDSLSRIVNNDHEVPPVDEELLNVPSAAMENKSELPFTHKSPRLSSGSERRSMGSSQDRCRSERLSFVADDEKRNGRCDHGFTSSRSRSPSERKSLKEEKHPHVEEQQAQLQNVLQSLGMSLEEQEINKLADRTQERLYGRKHKGMGNNSTDEQKNRQHRSSSSSSTTSSSHSSSSCSSSSTSRSGSHSPSRHQRSRSRDWKRRRKSKHKHSRDRNRDSVTHQDGRNEISTYQHSYPQNPGYPVPNPAVFSAFPEYGLSHNSQYNVHPSGSSSWMCTNPLAFYPSGHPYPQNTFYHFPGIGTPSNMAYPSQSHPEDVMLPANPDQSQSEGQVPVALGAHCLEQLTNQSGLKKHTKNHRSKSQDESQSKSRNSQKKTNLTVKQESALVAKPGSTQICDNQSGEEKQQNNVISLFEEEVPDVASAPPSQGSSSPNKRENNVNQGFQRFVSLLNKGVDIDSLSRIVNDDSQAPPVDEELLNVSSAAMENKSELPFTRPSSGSERKSMGSSQEKCKSQPAENERKNGRRDHSFNSNSRSRSPLERKKKRQEEKLHVEEQQAQLQNVLQSLGMSLEEQEINKLADRTQERLYGRKHKGMENNSIDDQENLQHRSSSSSSSSTSSSRSTSRSGSRSPSRHRRSRSRDWKRKRKSKHKHSRNKSRDGPTQQDSRKEISTYQHSYPQYQMYPYPNPAAFFAFPEYGLSQNSQYNVHPSGFSSWTSTQSTNPPAFYPSGLSYPPNAFYHFPGLGAASNIVYSARTQPEEMNLPVNPDLAESEGQGSVASGTRCLHVVQTKRLMSQKQFAENHRRKAQVESQEKNKKQEIESKEKAKTPHTFVVKSEPKESKEEKQPPTEEEIKANLRKKLEAFNQMVKQKFTQPATSLSSQTS